MKIWLHFPSVSDEVGRRLQEKLGVALADMS